MRYLPSDHMFSYVGGGDHLYVAGVSRKWRGRYMQHCAKTATRAHDKKFVTSYRSTIISECRLQHAEVNGFAVTHLDITKISDAAMICQYSLEPQQVVTVLKLHNAAWDYVICREAAYFGKLDLLQWLHKNDCQRNERNVLLNASRGGSVPMLEWLMSVTEPWSEDSTFKMLTNAASCDKLAAAQWLRDRGATWPNSFASQYKDTIAGTIKQCWSLSAVQWAIASGSGWLNWKCDDYAETKYHNNVDKQQASFVLKWAHANGCPCTCGHQQQQAQQ
jgi:hypothetical protein